VTLADLFEQHGQRTPADATGRIYGLAVGLVVDNKDPDQLGRVKLKLPWLTDEPESNWARVVTFMAGKDRGAVFLPEVDDEVLVGFEHGDVSYPYVLGGLFNGKDTPPFANDDGKNDKRMIKSRGGMTLTFDDKDGAEKVELADKDAKESIVIDMAAKKITLTSSGDLEVMAEQGAVTIKAKTLTVETSGAAEIKAGGTLDLKGQTVNVKGSPAVNIN
jgi:uncharacterized protein involved in type VI secretion and phage assembly